MTSQAIQTNLYGVEFRSRLEARWASFFTILGWHWEYEPFDCDGWIPDFLILGANPLLVEVKPASSAPSLRETESKVSKGSLDRDEDVMIVGCSPFLPSGHEYIQNDVCAGLHSQVFPGPDDGIRDTTRYFTDSTGWALCVKHGFCLLNQEGAWMGNPCGCYIEHGLLSDEGPIINLWRNASNNAKWKRT